MLLDSTLETSTTILLFSLDEHNNIQAQGQLST